MAIIGTNNEDEEFATSSTSPGAHAAQDLVHGGQDQTFANGGGAGGAPSPKAVASSQPGGAGAGGNSYTNLTQYLAANQDSGGTTGQGAANVVKGSAANADQAINTFGQSAGTAVKGASDAVGVDKNTLASIQGGIPDTSARAAGVKTAADKAANSGGFGLAPEGYGGEIDFSNVTYGGPQTITPTVYNNPMASGAFSGTAGQDQQAAQGQIDTATKDAAAIKDQAGVSGLLGRAYGKPGYSAGEKSLDSFLAGGTTSGKAALDQASGLGTQEQGSYANLLASLQSGITAGQGNAALTDATYKDAITDAQNTTTGKRAALSDAATAAIKKANDARTAYSNANQKPLAASNTAPAISAEQVLSKSPMPQTRADGSPGIADPDPAIQQIINSLASDGSYAGPVDFRGIADPAMRDKLSSAASKMIAEHGYHQTSNGDPNVHDNPYDPSTNGIPVMSQIQGGIGPDGYYQGPVDFSNITDAGLRKAYADAATAQIAKSVGYRDPNAPTAAATAAAAAAAASTAAAASKPTDTVTDGGGNSATLGNPFVNVNMNPISPALPINPPVPGGVLGQTLQPLVKVNNAAQAATNSVGNALRHTKMFASKGGKVPSYEKLRNMLSGGR